MMLRTLPRTLPRTMRIASLVTMLVSSAALACGGHAPAPAPTPTTRASPPPLPPVPLVEGPLAPRVQYPSSNAVIQARDSNFIFGTVGNGRATLTVNGVSVPVLPNGSWLAWLPLPPADAPRYDLVATLGADTMRLSHPVRLQPPRRVLSDTGRLVVDSASAAPRGDFMLRPTESVRVSVRAPANAVAWVEGAPRARRALVSSAADTSARPLGDAELFATDVPAAWLGDSARIVVARGADTVRLRLARIAPATDSVRHWALLSPSAGMPSVASDTDRATIVRPTAGGTYKWFLFPGTQVEVTGRLGDYTRIALDDGLEAWVANGDVRALPPGFAAPRRVASNARVVPAAQWTDVVIPVGARPPFLVEERGSELVLTLYGTRATTDIINYAAGDSLVRVVNWEQLTSDRARYTVRLSAPPFGYLALYERGAFVLRVRRPPVVDRAAPLRGLTIAVDPGHPPIGATGPTGLWEPVPTLAVGERLRDILEARGARVVMTRTGPEAVELGLRPVIARRADADALVSIHLNALPDGINPYAAQGTGTYFFHPQAEPLARAVQAGMVAAMGLRDLGVYYDNLALARPTWMPAILCEGAFIMIPEQEAALRTPAFQERYARGIADGLERYFRDLAR